MVEQMPPQQSRASTHRKRKTKKKRPVLLAFFILLFAIIGVATVFGISVILEGKKAIETISIAEEPLDENNKPIVVPKELSVKKKPVAVMIMGVDSRPGAGGLNTDVMMLAALNPSTKKGVVVSMPRDTKIEVDGYRARKANAFYADFYVQAQRDGAKKTGAMLAGKKAVKEVFGSYFGIDVKYAATINFQGFIDLVDELDGIEVDVDMRMKYTDSHDNTNINLEPGFQPLTGQQALDFVRYRQSNNGKNMSSDFERNERQGKVVSAIMDKMLSLGGITKIKNVIEVVSDDISTDMPSSEIYNAISTYFGIKTSDITFIALQGDWRSPYVYADEQSLEEIKALLQKIMSE